MLTNSLYEPHGTYVSGFTFLVHQKCPKKSHSIVSLSSRGWNSLPGACSDLDLDTKDIGKQSRVDLVGLAQNMFYLSIFSKDPCALRIIMFDNFC
jgi:hypothetical protein